MNPTDRDRLLALFRHAAADAPAPAPHVADDDELLTAWRLGALSPAEDARFHEHLAACAACRRHAAELARADTAPPAPAEVPELPPVSPPVVPAPESSQWRSVLGVALALAACAVLTVGWLVVPSSEARDLARAEADFHDGKPEAALARLMRVPPDRLTARQQEKRRRLLERAAYQAVRDDLEAGHHEVASARVVAAKAAGADPDRLDGLKVMADRRLPLRPVLTPDGGSLLDRGFLPDGAKQATRAAPAPEDDLRAAWETVVASDGDDPAVLVNAGDFLLSQRRLPEARALFERATRLRPADAGGFIGLGLADAAEGKFDTALGHFRAALAVAPDAPALLIDVAVCHEGLKDPASARPYWEKAHERTTDPQTRARIARHLKRE